jgi:hypothetical protein
MRECKRGQRVRVDGDKKMEGTAEMAEDVCAKRARGGAEGAPRRATEAERAEKGRRGGGGAEK